MPKPTLYIAVDLHQGIVRTHLPVDMDVEIEILDLDEPDAPGLKARGIEHPMITSERLAADTENYTTIDHH